MKKIVFVSHCILNTASKVVLYKREDIDAEEKLRLRFMQKALDKGVQIVQLPCPEFTLYGAKRWGHVSGQFDNPFFRKHCQEILEPVIDQLKEYLNNDDRFEVLGIVGIDGSPSCGVDYTCYGNCLGAFDGRTDLEETLQSIRLDKGKGVFMDVLDEMLKQNGLEDRIVMKSLFATEPDKCLDLIQ